MRCLLLLLLKSLNVPEYNGTLFSSYRLYVAPAPNHVNLVFCSATAAIMSDSAFKDGSGKYIFRGDIHTALISFASIRYFPCNGLNGDEYC